jgi:hypothetical protein
MSDFEDKIEDLLREAFPKLTIFRGHPIKFDNEQMFADFFLPTLNVIVECHGIQHYKFVPHFHNDEAGFKAHQERDERKRQWARKNKVRMIEIPYDQCPETAAELFYMIYNGG